MANSRVRSVTLSDVIRNASNETLAANGWTRKTPSPEPTPAIAHRVAAAPKRTKRSYELSLPYPPSANRYWRVYRGIVTKSAEATSYQRAVRVTARAAGCEMLSGDISVTMYVYRPLKRGDLDNRIKVLLDALNGAVYTDDDQVTVIHAERRDDKDNPRVEVLIEQV